MTARPSLLYLSYDDKAYLPSDTGLPYEGGWRALRLATEQVLDEVSDQWDVVVKEHPQQADADSALGPAVRRAARDADTRSLILAADAVVGFQTTAIFEAAAAGRPVVYAAWGDELERAQPMLIPIHDHPEVAMWARSPEELRSLLRAPRTTLRRPDASADEVIAAHIGIVDGKAANRVLDVIRDVAVAAHAPAAPPPASVARAIAISGAVPAIHILAGGAAILRRHQIAMALRRRAAHWTQERSELRAISRRVWEQIQSR